MNYPDFFSKGPSNCSTTTDPDSFFPDAEVAGSISKANQAKKLCIGCVYVTECLAWALQENEPGVWGGTTTRQRIRMRRSDRRINPAAGGAAPEARPGTPRSTADLHY